MGRTRPHPPKSPEGPATCRPVMSGTASGLLLRSVRAIVAGPNITGIAPTTRSQHVSEGRYQHLKRISDMASLPGFTADDALFPAGPPSRMIRSHHLESNRVVPPHRLLTDCGPFKGCGRLCCDWYLNFVNGFPVLTSYCWWERNVFDPTCMGGVWVNSL